MSAESEPLEAYYASDTLPGLIRSGFLLLIARRVRPRTGSLLRKLYLDNALNYLLYAVLIVIPAFFLEIFQRLRTLLTGRPREHPQGSWQFYLRTGLREDTAHHTNETEGYHLKHPPAATELDDLTAWVMAVIQFLWHYEELMGVVWDEWTLLRLVDQAGEEVEMQDNDLFHRLQRQWEVARPYHAPLNGTYADVRWAAFKQFIQRRLDALPPRLRDRVLRQHAELAADERAAYIKQMSLLATVEPGRYADSKRPVLLWDARIGLIVDGTYYLIPVVDHDEQGHPAVYGMDGRRTPLSRAGGSFAAPGGERVSVEKDQVYDAAGGLVGYLDMAAASRVKGQLRAILNAHGRGDTLDGETPPDVLLAETPRHAQRRLRALLSDDDRSTLDALARAPVIINWNDHSRDQHLSELRRVRRGVGDHALTIIRTESSFVFDQSHLFFDGTWSLAMAEVLTNTAVRWCERCMTMASADASPARPLTLKGTPAFQREAIRSQNPPEVAAETTIFDISTIFALREELEKRNGTYLTVNDLIVITRILHAAHYESSPPLREAIEAFKAGADTRVEQQAARAIDQSLRRGRVLNPALLIPVDASPTEPRERIFPITFRNLTDNLVWVWDDAWDAYQEYRRYDPPDSPESAVAYRDFSLKRTLLVGHLRAFSFILAANKDVAIRGESLNIAILKLLVGLPPWLQHRLKEIPERVPPLNEIIRGDEVYSNVGRVAKGSSLTRFTTAKDDGNTKALAWGVMSDDQGRMSITMRDFRPHVQPLLQAGRDDLAADLAQDYVVAYTTALIGLIARLTAMLQAEEPSILPEKQVQLF
jgi:hypothetical protein